MHRLCHTRLSKCLVKWKLTFHAMKGNDHLGKKASVLEVILKAIHSNLAGRDVWRFLKSSLDLKVKLRKHSGLLWDQYFI